MYKHQLTTCSNLRAKEWPRGLLIGGHNELAPVGPTRNAVMSMNQMRPAGRTVQRMINSGAPTRDIRGWLVGAAGIRMRAALFCGVTKAETSSRIRHPLTTRGGRGDSSSRTNLSIVVALLAQPAYQLRSVKIWPRQTLSHHEEGLQSAPPPNLTPPVVRAEQGNPVAYWPWSAPI